MPSKRGRTTQHTKVASRKPNTRTPRSIPSSQHGGIHRACILTGGGDAPGLNAVLRAFVKSCEGVGIDVVGSEDGFEGLIQPGRLVNLGRGSVRGILPRGGSILGCSTRANPFAYPVTRGEWARALGRHVRHRRRTPQAARNRRIGSGRRRRHDAPRARVHAARCARHRRAQDDRQRPIGHRLHVRFRHRAQHGDVGDRHAAHHCRVARPRDGGRGHGPIRRLDRAMRRHRRRRRRRRRAGDPVRRRAHHLARSSIAPSKALRSA